MTVSQNFRIYLVRRNYCFEREREKTPIHRIFAKAKNADRMAQGADLNMKDNYYFYFKK